MPSTVITAAIIAAIVVLVELFFRGPLGERVGRFAPAPFWIYLLSIVGGITGVLPPQSPVYSFVSTYVLPAAIFLMLVGSPITWLLRLGHLATGALLVACGTMFTAMVLAFILFMPTLPPESWKAAGALTGTWIGGSANMVAVKEILAMRDTDLAPLIIIDTILSYAWLALLLVGPAFQRRFDAGVAVVPDAESPPEGSLRRHTLLPILVAAGAAVACVMTGHALVNVIPLLPASGWTLLAATTVAILVALTPLRCLERHGSSSQGQLALYLVLATIGAKTDLGAAAAAPIFLSFGALVLLIHGALLLVLGRAFRMPLSLLATASQAAVGGAVSAPIVAEAYRPGTASIGVLMAIGGTLMGTYAGVVAGWICGWLAGG